MHIIDSKIEACELRLQTSVGFKQICIRPVLDIAQGASSCLSKVWATEQRDMNMDILGGGLKGHTFGMMQEYCCM